MRMLRSGVQSPMATMLHTHHDFFLGCLVASKRVGDQHTWDVYAALQERAKELDRCCLVAPALDEDIQHVPVLIDGPPHVIGLAIDREEPFIQVPRVTRLCLPAPESVRKLLKTSHSFIGLC